tara:strand:+ start:1006 stop:1212 length:207 start_codon:yes stop_codon:yes gene_type:complete
MSRGVDWNRIEAERTAVNNRAEMRKPLNERYKLKKKNHEGVRHDFGESPYKALGDGGFERKAINFSIV